MSGFYPSLEDLEVDSMARAQTNAARAVAAISSAEAHRAQATGVVVTETRSLYAGLGLEEFLTDDFMGLDVSDQAIVAALPQDVAVAMQPPAAGAGAVATLPGAHAIASITPKGDVNMRRAEIKQGVREVILAKDGKGKLGIAVKSIDKGVFVSFVWQGSAASMAGVRFCDQILQIDGETVAGWSEKQVLKKLKEASAERVSLAIRERPWCRTVTSVKDSLNHVGFTFRDGEINNIVKDSSAARNGLLIHHRIVEVNGQNVVGLPDKDIQGVIRASPRSVTLTIMPTFIYKHLVKKLGSSMIRKYMDHSIPDI
jgi:syntenin-1